MHLSSTVRGSLLCMDCLLPGLLLAAAKDGGIATVTRRTQLVRRLACLLAGSGGSGTAAVQSPQRVPPHPCCPCASPQAHPHPAAPTTPPTCMSPVQHVVIQLDDKEGWICNDAPQLAAVERVVCGPLHAVLAVIQLLHHLVWTEHAGGIRGGNRLHLLLLLLLLLRCGRLGGCSGTSHRCVPLASSPG